MVGSIRFDHAVILVPDLGRARMEFERLGFTVTAGGVHRGGATRNALIAFADGSYLELITYTRRLVAHTLPWIGRLGLGRVLTGSKTPIDERFGGRGSRGFGLIDFALDPGTLDGALIRLRREGIRIEGPFPGGRTSSEGEPIEWEIALPSPRELPFLCADVTDRHLRVPGGDAVDHANSVTGIAGITVAVESVETSSARYRALLGVEPDPGARERLREARGRIFNVSGTEIVVATATSGTHPLRRHLRERGEGPAMIHLRAEEGGTALRIGSTTATAHLEVIPAGAAAPKS